MTHVITQSKNTEIFGRSTILHVVHLKIKRIYINGLLAPGGETLHGKE
jgi:hypothetical protein